MRVNMHKRKSEEQTLSVHVYKKTENDTEKEGVLLLSAYIISNDSVFCESENGMRCRSLSLKGRRQN